MRDVICNITSYVRLLRKCLKTSPVSGALSVLILMTGAAPAQVNPGPGAGSSKVISMLDYQYLCSPKTLCEKGFAKAVQDARTYLNAYPQDNYTLTIPAGVFDFSDETKALPGSKSAISLTGIRPTTGHFTLKGAGSARTTLITANEIGQFEGYNISNILIEGMTLRRKSMGATQGTVVRASQGQITIEVPSGFPLVTEMFNPASGNGNWLRVFDNSNPLDPHMNVDLSNVQIHFGHSRQPECQGRLCTIYLDPPTVNVPAIYRQPHQVVGVKSSKGGGAYTFDDSKTAEGRDVGFNDVIWYDISRGVWINFKGSFVTNSAIRRRAPVNGQTQVMSTSNGGPQFVAQKIKPGSGGSNRVENFVAESTGDDSIAMFNDDSNTSTISNTVISSSFARTINLFKSCQVKLENNVGRYCSPQVDFPKQYKGCVTDTSHPGPTPCTPNL